MIGHVRVHEVALFCLRGYLLRAINYVWLEIRQDWFDTRGDGTAVLEGLSDVHAVLVPIIGRSSGRDVSPYIICYANVNKMRV